MDCICCNYKNDGGVLFESTYVVSVAVNDAVLIGSYIIIPKAHKETPFDLSDEEWNDTKKMIDMVKKYLDENYEPDGYNLGWNIGKAGGQEVFHAHLHVIPRFKDEPFAGKGIRHWLKKTENKRPSNPLV